MKVYHGTILTCDREGRVCSWLVEDRGRIVYTGDTLPEEYSQTERVELEEKALCPSFVDTHLHFASMALFHSGVNVMDARSNTEIQQRLKDFIQSPGEASPSGKRKEKNIIAFGASPHSVEEKRLLSREELDEVSDETGIMVVKYDGHACIVNSALLKQLPEKVKEMRGYNAESGEMNQEAFFGTSDFISGSIPVSRLVQSMQDAVDYIAEKGIGMIHTVSGVGFPRDLDVDMERFIGRSVQNGFQMRLFFQTMDTSKVRKRGLPRIGGCFITALDGCFGSVDAALNSPYEGSDDCGVLYYSDEEVAEFCKKANREGLQIELHAIGDAAFDQAARALRSALEDCPREDHRHGIIHACLPTEEGLEICSRYGIHIPLQTAFIDWPQEPSSYLRSILGDREASLNPLRTFMEKGIPFSAGSDSPCTDPDPMLWIHNACNHSEKDQSLSVQEAFRMATWEGCRASFDEKERGSLEAGKIADMVILGKNPLTVPKEELKRVPVQKLILQGREYRKHKKHWLLALVRGMISRRRI